MSCEWNLCAANSITVVAQVSVCRELLSSEAVQIRTVLDCELLRDDLPLDLQGIEHTLCCQSHSRI